MSNSHKSSHSLDSNGDVFRRKPIATQNELKTRADYEEMIAEMRAMNSKDIEVMGNFLKTLSGALLIAFILFTYETFTAIGKNAYPKIPLTNIKIKNDNCIYFCELIVVSLQASLTISGKTSFSFLTKCVVIGLTLADIYLVVTSYKYGIVEMIFWSVPTAILIITGLVQLTVVKSIRSIDEYENKVMSRFKD
ncbi:hypothetical protein AYI68_g5117 [Smittium mucronatum]|uniref:Transmembrane protein n=1 Tax=Smittium mucronatum TaxID=133383 RepID=A0A1R0GV58_9FUNG|nr:hypothetical protein AYI68_g5117 [Smittium mucronatum]